MREFKVPEMHSFSKLEKFIKSLDKEADDYDTAAYCASLAATAAFYYICHKNGLTGFQASYADLDFIRRVRRIEGPFILLKMEDMLYPQYNLNEKLYNIMYSQNTKNWLRDEAKKLLTESNENTSPRVLEHWKKLAKE